MGCNLDKKCEERNVEAEKSKGDLKMEFLVIRLRLFVM